MRELAPDQPTRAQYMSNEGADLYNSWTRAVVEATVTDDFLTSFPEQVRQCQPHDRFAPPKPIFSAESIRGRLSGAMKVADEAAGITRDLLIPNHDDIIKYTSANYFGDWRKKSDEARYERVFKHAHDSMHFGIGASAGFVFDCFVERYGEIVDARLFNDNKEARPMQAELGRMMGSMWDKSYNLQREGRPEVVINQTLNLQKLAFIARSLRNNTSAVDCLVELSKTGFDVLTGESAIVGDKYDMSILTKEDRWRSKRLGIESEHFVSVMRYDDAEQRFSVPPEVITFMRQVMKRQNQKGLNRREQTQASGLKKFKRNFTAGCPVAVEIPTAAKAMGRAVQAVADYHRDQ